MKATYHQEAPNKHATFDVLRTNDDGTVDLGYGTEKEGTLVVGRCPVSAEPKPGHATLEKPAKKKEAEAETAKTEEPAEKKADDKAKAEKPKK